MISADALSRVVKQSVADLQALEASAAKKPLYNKKYRGMGRPSACLLTLTYVRTFNISLLDFAGKWRELEADIAFANRVAASPLVSNPFVSKADVYNQLNMVGKVRSKA